MSVIEGVVLSPATRSVDGAGATTSAAAVGVRPGDTVTWQLPPDGNTPPQFVEYEAPAGNAGETAAVSPLASWSPVFVMVIVRIAPVSAAFSRGLFADSASLSTLGTRVVVCAAGGGATADGGAAGGSGGGEGGGMSGVGATAMGANGKPPPPPPPHAKSIAGSVAVSTIRDIGLSFVRRP